MNENTSLTPAELGRHRLWKPLLRARLLEEASAGFLVEEVEFNETWQRFCKNHGLEPANPAVPTDFTGCSSDDLHEIVRRDLRIAKWKTALFEPHARERFEQRKPALDRVVYRLLRVKEAGLARELWFRLREGEATFAELAPDYASGNEIHTEAIIGPSLFGAMHPGLAQMLRASREKELMKPFAVAEWFLIARVEKFLPAEFDDAAKNLMIEELTQLWLEERTHGRSTA